MPMRRDIVAGAALLLAAGPAGAADYSWQPDQPITIIVPWAAGGSTDQVTRVAAGEIEEALGQKIVVVNQPGASGSIGTKAALDATRDGTTWTAGAAQDLGTYIVLGMLDTKIEDWHLYLNVANVAVVGVNPDSPYQTMGELLQAMEESPGEITVATAGLNSAGHNAIESIREAAGIEYRHVTYDGGNPAVIATVSGETEVTTQLAVEQAEMIRAGRIRPLAVLSDQPLELAGHGTIPPLTETLEGFPTAPNYFGIFIPEGVPDEVVETMDAIWANEIVNSEALKEYATSRGAQFAPHSGEEAQKRVQPAVRMNAWLLYDAGKAQTSPDQVGIERP
jgi:tripartite-type tricarboxylate transporter receptor subunit TctC